LAILNGLSQMRLNGGRDTGWVFFKHIPLSSILMIKLTFLIWSNTEESEQTRNPGLSQASVDILGIVCNLRLQRGGMVQNSEQYELIHRALCLHI
jgi:hypothetical protein